jgi:hypothetical protein
MASAIYLKQIGGVDLSTSGWQVVRWTDAASGSSHNNLPDSGDTFTLIDSGP